MRGAPCCRTSVDRSMRRRLRRSSPLLSIMRVKGPTQLEHRYNVDAVRRPVLTLLILSLLTFFLGLGRQAITDADEGFYAEAAREMVESGDWLTPHFNYADRWQKPILYYWLTASTYAAAGVTEGAARFWSALSGLGLVLLTWSAARKMTAD